LFYPPLFSPDDSNNSPLLYTYLLLRKTRGIDENKNNREEGSGTATPLKGSPSLFPVTAISWDIA
jgi:hypothetical protein